MTTPIFRLVPALTSNTADFWSGGAQGELRIQRCQACGYWAHPPTDICSRCLSRDLAAEPTSGKGSLFSFAVSHQAAGPDVPIPYTIALVELPEQSGLRVLSNLVNCAPEDARVDMPVRVLFEQHDDVFVPLFEPDVS
jgi:uncharacterized OB-fold protein